MHMGYGSWGVGIFGFLNIVFILVMFGLSIYSLILFIKLANRGIRALDLHIEEMQKKKF